MSYLLAIRLLLSALAYLVKRNAEKEKKPAGSKREVPVYFFYPDGVDMINTAPYDTPLLSFDNEEHHKTNREAVLLGVPYANNVVLDHAVDGYNTCIAGTGHMNYTDLPLFSPFLAKMLGIGDVDAEACILKMNEMLCCKRVSKNWGNCTQRTIDLCGSFSVAYLCAWYSRFNRFDRGIYKTSVSTKFPAQCRISKTIPLLQ